MNIAEIRKKKKKSEKKDQVSEEIIKKEASLSSDNTLPIPQKEEKLPEEYIESPIEALDFIDEESFYSNIHKISEEKEKAEYLCFLLGDEEYGIEVKIAKEVLKFKEITPVPKTSDIILGIVAIRGEIIPVFDIKKILGIEFSHYDEKNKKLILLKVDNEFLCIVTDKIVQIRKISKDQIEPPPLNVSITKQEFLYGVVILDGKIIRILDIEKMLTY